MLVRRAARGDYFNSHPRVGGDKWLSKLLEEHIISIRTPAWGVTDCKDFRRNNENISIRTPAWGVTHFRYVQIEVVVISIRTPAWGVTLPALSISTTVIFQFAPPRGG